MCRRTVARPEAETMEKEGPPDQPGQQSPSSPTDLLTVRAWKGRSFTARWVKKTIGTEMRAIMGPPRDVFVRTQARTQARSILVTGRWWRTEDRESVKAQ